MSLISIDDLSNKQILSIIDKSIKISKNNNLYPAHSYLSEHIFAILFFEPSTRTKLSFESAIYKCNGKIINYDYNYSTANKGESFEDIIKTINYYCDALIIRHHDKNIFNNISSLTNKPVINAGNGSFEHPTQALIDATTIKYHFNELLFSTPQVLLVGDLSHSRTINSLIKCLHKIYPDIIFYCLGIKPVLSIEHWDNDIYNYICNNNITITEIQEYQNVIDCVDIIYMSKPQNEIHDTVFHKNIILTPDLIEKMKPQSIIMHPMPRTYELPPICDNNHRSIYFKQSEFAPIVRRVILEYLMGYIKL
jgi:aspartate carbamoyltransferase catalytic subunit